MADPVDQDVGWFDVTVHHTARVDGGQRIGDLDPDLQDPLLASPVLRLEPLSQRPARTELHDQVRPTVGQHADVMDPHDASVTR